MAAPAARFRQTLSAPGLIQKLRDSFSQVQDKRRANSVHHSMPDALMAAFAMFNLKYSSMLRFDTEAHADPRLIHNLKSLFGLNKVPCDTQMRQILDPVKPEALRPCFEALHHELQRGKVLEDFTVLGAYYLLAIDGTGQFASNKISCPHCCVKNRSNGTKEFYHQILAAVMVHPELKTVMPIAFEPITKRDGANKNDCERNAAKRLLTYLADAFGQRPFLIVEDALASNGPHVELLYKLGMDFILGVKPNGNAKLFEQVFQRQCDKTLVEWSSEVALDGSCHGYRFTNALSLNESHPELMVNYLGYWSLDKRDKDGNEGNQHTFSWVTSLEVTIENVRDIARAGRTRWRVENETFNVLKNQGYEFEHNYGHGEQFLSSTLAGLMMLAFLVDQIQEHSCRVFQQARKSRGTKKTLWMQMRFMMSTFRIPDWQTYMALLIDPDSVSMHTGHIDSG
jgi:hypothetical protein